MNICVCCVCCVRACARNNGKCKKEEQDIKLECSNARELCGTKTQKWLITIIKSYDDADNRRESPGVVANALGCDIVVSD